MLPISSFQLTLPPNAESSKPRPNGIQPGGQLSYAPFPFGSANIGASSFSDKIFSAVFQIFFSCIVVVRGTM